MKFAAALSLALAPVALAKAIHNVYPVRRDDGKSSKNSKGSSSSSNAAALAAAEAAVLAEAGLALGSLGEVIVIWVNGGNGASTTTINSVQTVTQTVTAGAAAATTAAAGTTTAGSGSTTTATGAITTHTVTVGGAKGLVYEPDTIEAAVGDMVIFTFLAQNHTVTQSAFAKPCVALAGGMNSGFQANINNSVSPPPQVAMQVMVSTPLWFYCAQKGHCGKGMVFSINPTAAKTQAMFQQMAIAQNGTGTGSAITGNSTTTAAAAAATTTTAAANAAASGTAVAAVSSSSSTTVAVAATSTTTAVGSSGTIVTGTGTLNTDGSCACAVVCGVGSFPAVQAQGIGSFGGFSNALPSGMAVRAL